MTPGGSPAGAQPVPATLPRKTALRLPAATEFLGLVAVLGLLIAYFGFKTEHFFSADTFITIANQVPDVVAVATGMTFVLIIGGIDLSVGSILALSGAVLGVGLARLGWPLPVALAACLGVGLVCGAANGIVTVRWALPSFIVTLGMLEIARGGTLLVTNSQNLWIGAPLEPIYSVSLGGLALPFFLSLLLVAAAQFFLSYSAVGRYMIAIGTKEEAARLSGINTWPIKVSVFMLSGALSSVAAIVQAGRTLSADPNAGRGFELQAIAAAVIGGTSLMGGRGSVVGSFLGVLIIAVLENGLVQMDVRDAVKQVVTGCVIVLAVILDYYRHRLAHGRG
jgi:ribose transport system permease protein